MRVYDLGEISSHAASPFSHRREDWGNSVSAVELFNNEYSNSSLFEESRIGRTRIGELFSRRQEQEFRIREEFLETDSYEHMQDRRSWVIPMDKVEHFRNIDEDMIYPILCYKPVRDGVVAGRLEGFEGIDASLLGDDDPFDRLINNGTGTVQPDGSCELNWDFRYGDPNLSFKELDTIEEMRRVIREELLANDIDPTNSYNTID